MYLGCVHRAEAKVWALVSDLGDEWDGGCYNLLPTIASILATNLPSEAWVHMAGIPNATDFLAQRVGIRWWNWNLSCFHIFCLLFFNRFLILLVHSFVCLSFFLFIIVIMMMIIFFKP